MIVATYVDHSVSAPKCVSPVIDIMRSMKGWAFTEKAFEMQVRRIEQAASMVTRTKVDVVRNENACNITIGNVIKERVYCNLFYVRVDDVLVEDSSGTAMPYLGKATQALYDMAKKCHVDTADEDTDVKEGGQP